MGGWWSSLPFSALFLPASRPGAPSRRTRSRAQRKVTRVPKRLEQLSCRDRLRAGGVGPGEGKARPPCSLPVLEGSLQQERSDSAQGQTAHRCSQCTWPSWVLLPIATAGCSAGHTRVQGQQRSSEPGLAVGSWGGSFVFTAHRPEVKEAQIKGEIPSL